MSGVTRLAQQESPLLNLPAELRNRVYHYIVGKTDRNNPTVLGMLTKSWPAPALLQTCRQIRYETSSIFYSSNAFFINSYEDDVSLIVAWLHLIGKTNRSVIRRIYFMDGITYDKDEAVDRIVDLHSTLLRMNVQVARNALFVLISKGDPDDGEQEWANLPVLQNEDEDEANMVPVIETSGT